MPDTKDSTPPKADTSQMFAGGQNDKPYAFAPQPADAPDKSDAKKPDAKKEG